MSTRENIRLIARAPLLNEFGKRDIMRGLPNILSLFRNELTKYNNTRARMLDSIYHMKLRLL